MKTSLVTFLCFAFFLFMPLVVLCQNNERMFDALLTAQFLKDEPGAVIFMVKRDSIIYNKAFGKADLELNVDMNVNSVFRLGSITKQFTACAILKLVEEGRLSLKDNIGRFISDFPQKNKEINIENLITHTSGVKNYTGLSRFTQNVKRSDLQPKELIDIFKDEPLEFEPGLDYRYSNSGYVLLGYIIEQITGKPYAEYIDEVFFQPLGMQNSFYDNPTRLIYCRASGYKGTGGSFENAEYLSPTLPYAAGSIVSNSEDLYKWHNALIEGKVINITTLENAWNSYKLPNGRLTGYGYGWEIGNVQGSPSVKHTGVVNGFVTYAAYLPKENLYISIFTNSEKNNNLDILASKMLAAQLRKPYSHKEIVMPEDKLKSYQGVYTMECGEQKTISYQDGELMYYSLGGLKSRLIPYGEGCFFIEGDLSTLNFERDKKGDAYCFTLSSTGLPVKGISRGEKVEALNRVEVSLKELNNYTGKYQFNPGPVFEVTLESDTLFGQVGNDKKELVPFAKHKFFARELDALIVFNLDDKNNVISLTKIQNGEMNAEKVVGEGIKSTEIKN